MHDEGREAGLKTINIFELHFEYLITYISNILYFHRFAVTELTIEIFVFNKALSNVFLNFLLQGFSASMIVQVDSPDSCDEKKYNCVYDHD
jgi:hypothetical protein